jgi:hypothetical protein
VLCASVEGAPLAEQLERKSTIVRWRSKKKQHVWLQRLLFQEQHCFG